MEKSAAPQTKLRKRDIAAIVIGVAAVMFGLLLVIDTLRNKKPAVLPQNQASSSATIKAYCSEGKTYLNKKQGYKICLNGTQVATSAAKNDSRVVFDKDSAAATGSAHLVTIETSTEDIDTIITRTRTTQKGAVEKKVRLDKTDATQFAFDSLQNPDIKLKETIVSKFKRVFIITLNSKLLDLAENEKTYSDLLADWAFIVGTPNPPWSDSRNVLIDSPWPADEISNPLTVNGKAHVFEGVINIRIKDNKGSVLANATATATTGIELSAFTKQIPFTKPSTTGGSIEIFTLSAKDGHEQDKINIPISFK